MPLEVSLKKKTGDFLLDVEFVAEKEIVALLGASGCGKSMTLKCIAGIETPDEGRIVLDGEVLFDSKERKNLSPQKRRVGYLFQQYALFPNMTVEQNIAAGAGKKQRGRVREMIRKMHLEGLEDHRPSELSGGQQQRTALARILVNEPKLLLLDEPFSALDSYLKWQVEFGIADILKEFSGETVFVSHSRDEVYRLCDSVCILTQGKSEGKYRVKELFDNPQTKSACMISGCKYFSNVKKTGEYSVYAQEWNVELTLSKPVEDTVSSIGVRAHFIELTDVPGENTILCRVMRVVEDVFSIVVMFLPEGGREQIRVEMQKETWNNWKDKTLWCLKIPQESIMLLKE